MKVFSVTSNKPVAWRCEVLSYCALCIFIILTSSGCSLSCSLCYCVQEVVLEFILYCFMIFFYWQSIWRTRHICCYVSPLYVSVPTWYNIVRAVRCVRNLNPVVVLLDVYFIGQVLTTTDQRSMSTANVSFSTSSLPSPATTTSRSEWNPNTCYHYAILALINFVFYIVATENYSVKN